MEEFCKDKKPPDINIIVVDIAWSNLETNNEGRDDFLSDRNYTH